MDNAILAHGLCNRIDYSITVGRSYASDLSRIKRAREDAIRRNNEGPDALASIHRAAGVSVLVGGVQAAPRLASEPLRCACGSAPKRCASSRAGLLKRPACAAPARLVLNVPTSPPRARRTVDPGLVRI